MNLRILSSILLSAEDIGRLKTRNQLLSPVTRRPCSAPWKISKMFASVTARSLQAEDELAQAETAANTAAVAVYKALGGVGGDRAPLILGRR